MIPSARSTVELPNTLTKAQIVAESHTVEETHTVEKPQNDSNLIIERLQAELKLAQEREKVACERYFKMYDELKNLEMKYGKHLAESNDTLQELIQVKDENESLRQELIQVRIENESLGQELNQVKDEFIAAVAALVATKTELGPKN